jgi:serine-type D-Ala-D-Ala carboxypeptidase (penicillin-binding protein 5/6)
LETVNLPRHWLRRARKTRASSWGWVLLVVLLAGGPTWAASSRQLTPRHPQRTTAEPGRLTAIAALLMDAKTGQVLYERNAHTEWPPASTTKIMTALVALERAPLDTWVTISAPVAHFREGTVVGLPEHARIRLRELLYGLLLPSGNDVALAVAEGVAGTTATFVAQMNARAAELGATQTHFTSPHGLYNPEHYSTAYDLALIGRAAMENPTFREIVQTRSWMFSIPGMRARRLVNHNRLLSRYPGADGIKTGYVHQSGLTLVASATHDGWRLIAVVLHSGDMYGDASRLLTYGFAHYHPALLAAAGEPFVTEELSGTDTPLVGTVLEPVYGVVTDGDTVQRRVTLEEHLTLPLRRGSQIGAVAFYDSGRLLRTVPLVAASDVRPHAQVTGILSWISHLVVRFPLSPVY